MPLTSLRFAMRRMLHHQHRSSLDGPGLEACEYLIDILELHFVDLPSDLALGCECDCFDQILAAAHDRAADSDAIHHDIDNRRAEFAGRKTDKTHGALAPHHPQGLSECGRRYRSYQHAMR